MGIFQDSQTVIFFFIFVLNKNFHFFSHFFFKIIFSIFFLKLFLNHSNLGEVIFCICWMLFGVAFYSFIIGIISAYFTNIETKETLLQKKIEALGELCEEMQIDQEVFEEIKESTEYSAEKIPYFW